MPEFVELIADEAVQRFTLVPTGAGESFVRDWITRYQAGWDDGSRVGFCIRSVSDGAFLGFAAIVELELDARQGEIGYMVAPAARGRGSRCAPSTCSRAGHSTTSGSSGSSSGSTLRTPRLNASPNAPGTGATVFCATRTSRKVSAPTRASGHACGPTRPYGA